MGTPLTLQTLSKSTKPTPRPTSESSAFLWEGKHWDGVTLKLEELDATAQHKRRPVWPWRYTSEETNQAQKTPADRKTRLKLHLKCCWSHVEKRWKCKFYCQTSPYKNCIMYLLLINRLNCSTWVPFSKHPQCNYFLEVTHKTKPHLALTLL